MNIQRGLSFLLSVGMLLAPLAEAKTVLPLSKAQLLSELEKKEKDFTAFYDNELEWLHKVINPLVFHLVKTNAELNEVSKEVDSWGSLEELSEKRPVAVRLDAERYLQKIRDSYLFLFIARLNFTQAKAKHLDSMKEIMDALGTVGAQHQDVKAKLQIIVAIYEKGDFDSLAAQATKDLEPKLEELDDQKREYFQNRLDISLRSIDLLLDQANQFKSRALWLSALGRVNNILANEELTKVDPQRISAYIEKINTSEVSIEESKKQILDEYRKLFTTKKLEKTDGGLEIVDFFNHFELDPAPPQEHFFAAEHFLHLASQLKSTARGTKNQDYQIIPVRYVVDGADNKSEKPKKPESGTDVRTRGRLGFEIDKNGKSKAKVTVERYSSSWGKNSRTSNHTTTTMDLDSPDGRNAAKELGLDLGVRNAEVSGPNPSSSTDTPAGDNGQNAGNNGNGNGNGQNAGNNSNNGNSGDGSGNNGNGDGNNGSGNGNNGDGKNRNGNNSNTANASQNSDNQNASSQGDRKTSRVLGPSGEPIGNSTNEDSEALPSPTSPDRVRTNVSRSETKTEKITDITVGEPMTPSDMKDKRDSIYNRDKDKIDRADNHNAARDFSSKVSDQELARRANEVSNKIKSGERALRANFDALMNQLKKNLNSPVRINLPESPKNSATNEEDVRISIEETRDVIAGLQAKMNTWASDRVKNQVNAGFNTSLDLLAAAENALNNGDTETAQSLTNAALDVLAAYGPMALSIGIGFTPAGDVADAVSLFSGVDPITGEKLDAVDRVAAAIGLFAGSRALWSGLAKNAASSKLGKTIGDLLSSGGIEDLAEGVTRVERYDALNRGPLSDRIMDVEKKTTYASTFRSGKYKVITRDKPTKVYRSTGPQGTSQSGFWSPEKPTGPTATIIDLALPGARNPATKVMEAEIPSNTPFSIGIAERQGHLPGGKLQIVVDEPNNLNNIKEVKE